MSIINKSVQIGIVQSLLTNCFRFSLLLSMVGLFLLTVLEARITLKVEVSAKAAVLLNTDTGAVLYEKNAHQPLFPASITKIGTAIYALEKKGHELDEAVMATADAVLAVHPLIKRAADTKHPPYRLEFGGSHMGIKIGEVLSLRVLLYGLMLSSGNDAANVIAEHVSGSVSQFIKELNAYVKSKGCLNTVLHTPHGLPYAEHKTTAYDMALLGREALKMAIFREIVKTVTYTRPPTNMQPASLLHQHNALVKPGGKFYYPKAIGIKTGYIKAVGYTLVAAAEDSNRKLIAVLLGCDNLEQRYRDAIALFDAAFNEEKAYRTLFSKDYDCFIIQPAGGKKVLEAELLSDLIIDYYPSEEQTFHSKVVWEDGALPIRKNDRVGEVCIFSDKGQMVSRSALFARSDVDPTFGHVLRHKLKTGKKILGDHHSYILAVIGVGFLGVAFLLHARRKKIKKF